MSATSANAAVLAARSRTYADEHARSWALRFDQRPGHMTTRALVIELSRALADQTPDRLHEGPSHIDGGGTPAMTGAFMAYLDGSPMQTVERQQREDSQGRELRPVFVGTYRKPLHAAIETMKRSRGKHAWWARIAERIILGSEAPTVAAMAEGSHQYEAGRTANEALSELYRRLTPEKLDLHSTGEAA